MDVLRSNTLQATQSHPQIPFTYLTLLLHCAGKQTVHSNAMT